MRTSNSIWIPDLKPFAKRRVLFFHHAGGSANQYLKYARALDSESEGILIELPGRGRRFSQPLISDFNEIIRQLMPDVSHCADRELILFGHSMGALIGFEVAQNLVKTGFKNIHLVVSACPAPSHTSTNANEIDPVLDQDERLISYLQALGGTSSEAFTNPELLSIILAIYRSDLIAIHEYRKNFVSESPSDYPITALGGEDDIGVPREALTAWRSHTRGYFDYQMFSGGHFYLNNQTEEVLVELTKAFEVQNNFAG